MSDLVKRLRGLYSVGPDGMGYPDRDFGSFTPRINKEAANRIEALENEVVRLSDIVGGQNRHIANNILEGK